MVCIGLQSIGIHTGAASYLHRQGELSVSKASLAATHCLHTLFLCSSKLRYEDKLKQTENSTRSISIIMTNILPVHVANIFLDGGLRKELFYENYSKVAVIFANIHNADSDRSGLRVLNEYICYYDDLLEEYNTSSFKVEKIKVIGWTYMAACGLQAENLTDYWKPKGNRKKSNRTKST